MPNPIDFDNLDAAIDGYESPPPASNVTIVINDDDEETVDSSKYDIYKYLLRIVSLILQ